MSVASIAGGSVYGPFSSGGAAQNDAGYESSDTIRTKVAGLLHVAGGPNDSSAVTAAVFPALGHQGLAGSVMLAFSRLGYTLPASAGHLPDTASANAAPSSVSSGADSFTLAKDMRAFMQALFAAVNGGGSTAAAQGAANSAATGNAQSAANGFVAALQSLASRVSTTSAGAGSGLSAYDQLQAAFQKLLSDLPSRGATAGTGAANGSLPAFLQTLANTLSTTSGGAPGGLVNASA